ncbi:MAG: (d)CMP kinase [Robiginitomaculum sp.]
MPVIAIDGTFASGKGTLGRAIAAHYGFKYLDTGKLYRACAFAAIKAKADLSDGAVCAKLALEIKPKDLTDPELKSGDVGAAASKIAVHTQVRAALLTLQREFAASPKGAVLDGRDIGTVICPDADVKLYVDAAPEIRARRRYEELSGYGEDTSFEKVLAQLTERDGRDKGRKTAPLKPADDAHLLDTSALDIKGALAAAIAIIDAALGAAA